jgi:hypothetical protein
VRSAVDPAEKTTLHCQRNSSRNKRLGMRSRNRRSLIRTYGSLAVGLLLVMAKPCTDNSRWLSNIPRCFIRKLWPLETSTTMESSTWSLQMLVGAPSVCFWEMVTEPFKHTTNMRPQTIPLWVVVGDFNRDGNLDLAASNYTDLGGGQLAISNRGFPRGIQVVNLADGSEVERLIFLPPTYPEGRAFAPVGAAAFGPDQFIVRVVGDAGTLKIVSRTGTPDNTILPNATLPMRFPDLALSSPAVGRSVQVFDSGTGPGIFTGRLSQLGRTFGVILSALCFRNKQEGAVCHEVFTAARTCPFPWKYPTLSNITIRRRVL